MNDLERFALMETNRHLIDERDDLQAELDQAYTKLRYALAALGRVEWVMRPERYGHDKYICPWCNEEDKHAPDCQRQLVLQMLPLEVGEK